MDENYITDRNMVSYQNEWERKVVGETVKIE